MGLGRLPEGQQLIAQAHHMGVGDVLEAQVEGIGQSAAGLLGAEHAAVEELVGHFLGLPALGAHEAIAQLRLTARKAKGGDHAVAIKGVMHPLAATLQPAGAIAVERARQLRRNGTASRRELHPIELHAHVAERTGPVSAVVGRGSSRSSGHRGSGRREPRSSRNGVLRRLTPHRGRAQAPARSSTPLLLGTAPARRGSTSVAWRRARANALKQASTM